MFFFYKVLLSIFIRHPAEILFCCFLKIEEKSHAKFSSNSLFVQNISSILIGAIPSLISSQPATAYHIWKK